VFTIHISKARKWLQQNMKTQKLLLHFPSMPFYRSKCRMAATASPLCSRKVLSATFGSNCARYWRKKHHIASLWQSEGCTVNSMRKKNIKKKRTQLTSSSFAIMSTSAALILTAANSFSLQGRKYHLCFEIQQHRISHKQLRNKPDEGEMIF
jgi:hypothetical protein